MLQKKHINQCTIIRTLTITQFFNRNTRVVIRKYNFKNKIVKNDLAGHLFDQRYIDFFTVIKLYLQIESNWNSVCRASSQKQTIECLFLDVLHMSLFVWGVRYIVWSHTELNKFAKLIKCRSVWMCLRARASIHVHCASCGPLYTCDWTHGFIYLFFHFCLCLLFRKLNAAVICLTFLLRSMNLDTITDRKVQKTVELKFSISTVRSLLLPSSLVKLILNVTKGI